LYINKLILGTPGGKRILRVARSNAVTHSLHFDRQIRRKFRHYNCLERVSQPLKRRTRVVQGFLNESSSLKLVSAILVVIGEEWEIGRLYFEMDPDWFTSSRGLVTNITEKMLCHQITT